MSLADNPRLRPRVNNQGVAASVDGATIRVTRDVRSIASYNGPSFTFRPMGLDSDMIRYGLLITFVVASAARADEIDFNRDVRPILSDMCSQCHGPDANARQADLRLDTKAGLFTKHGNVIPVVPKHPEQSELIRRITANDPDERMPPADSNLKLSKKQVDILTQWVKSGAEWKGHWSFEPPIKTKVPTVKNANWPRNAVDHFVLAKIEAAGLKAQDSASKEKLLRRVSLDLTGLPPTLAELDAFLADKSDDAYEKAVDRLLQSRAYGERMAWDWLDAARYADSNGYQGDRERTMWPWRDWVVDSLNKNMPFDQFTVWQLAGDLLPNATVEQKLATGFCRNHMINGEGGRIPEENRIEYVFDQTETMATVWMGLTFTCCRCHDHKFDPFSKKEYFQLFAFFNRTPVNGAGGDPAMAPNMQVETADAKSRIEGLQKQLLASQKLISGRKRALAPGQAGWEKQFEGKGKRSLWMELAPSAMKSEAGQELRVLDDGSIFVGGQNKKFDTYTITTKSPVAELAAVRLVGLRHSSFTRGGIARSDSGNFVLTGFEVTIKRPSDKKPRPVKLASAQASHEQGSYKISNVLNGNPKTGWAVLQGEWKSDVTGIFRLAQPIKNTKDAELTITLRHNSQHVYHNIGRFRLYTSSKPDVKLGEKEDPFLAAIAVAPNKRTRAQANIVMERYFNSDAEIKRLTGQVKKANDQIAAVRRSFPRVMIMQDLPNPRKTFMLTRGIYNKPEGEVSTGLPTVLPTLKEAKNPNRLDLANWLVNGKHPLTARVTVNRIWQQFFGNGLVKTTEDFGVQGEKPSHPDLLDWLAVTFIESDWDVKAMHRLIVTSSAYRQSAKISKQALEQDPENRLVSRGPRFRMPSWMIRDAGLASSGLLVETKGGPPVKPYQPTGVWAEATFGKKKYTQDTGDKLYRRSLYTFWRRIVGPTMFFDVGKRQTCTVRTGRTNTPLHALTTLNDITFVEIARAMAQSILESPAKNADQQVTAAFRLATSRQPTAREVKILTNRLKLLEADFREHPEDAASLLKVGDSPRNEKLDPTKHAAMTGLCHLVLNLDEALSN